MSNVKQQPHCCGAGGSGGCHK